MVHHSSANARSVDRDPVTVIPGVGRGAVIVRARDGEDAVIVSIMLDDSADEDDKAFWIQAAREYARRKGMTRLRAI